MDNEKQNQNNRKSEPEQNSSQENIPLWLQGLDNSEEEDKGGATKEVQAEGSWTKEVNDSSEETNQKDQQHEKILPDWLSTLSEVESEMPKIMDNQKADNWNDMTEKNKSENDSYDADETTEKVEIKNSPSEDFSELVDSPVDDNFSDDGFVEISEMDLSDKPQPDQLALDESLSEAEELPYWLKDMIVEQPGESYPNKAMTYAEIVALSKEDTKPVKISGEPEASEEAPPKETLSEVEQKEPEDSVGADEQDESETIEEPEATEEPVQEESIADEAPAAFIEDDTKPVRPHPEIPEIEEVSATETDQPPAVEEEAALADQMPVSSQIQEESEELIEPDQDQWEEKEVSDQAIMAEPEAPADWVELEPVVEEPEAPDQWLEQEPVEEETAPPPTWPEQEPALQETELQAPEQWREEEPEEQEPEAEASDHWQEQEQVEESEPAIDGEHELREAMDERIAAEETEEIKVKGIDQAPETVQEQQEIEQPTDLDQAQPDDVLETELELPITPRPEPVAEDVPLAPEVAEQPGGTPKTLRFAKYLLDQGDFDRAKEIFKPYIENSEFLEDIEDWLVEASNNGAKNHSGTWELIGDIAMAQSHPNRAFEAYKQAITVLLSTKKEIDETH